VKRRLLLNVVQGMSILQLLSCTNQTLLVGCDLSLDLRFHVADGVLRLDLQCLELAFYCYLELEIMSLFGMASK